MAKLGIASISLLSLFALLSLQFCASDAGLLNRIVASGGQEISGDNGRYVVVFDAGKFMTTVHVFNFDQNVNLLKINGSLEVSHQVQEVLSSYADNPAAVAIDELFLLGEKKYEKILNVIRDLLSESPFLYKSEWVTILPGAKQGVYLWETINYLMGNVGRDYSKTVAVLNQDVATVQMAYAVSLKAAINAPKLPRGEEYITAHHIQSNNYYLYSHGYFPYGAYAVRAEILKYTNDSYNYCMTSGYNEQMNYYGEIYNVRASPSGSSYEKCRENVLQALNLKATCYIKNCTFDGAWNGGGGAGLEKIYLTGGFHNTGADVGITNRDIPSTDLKLLEYEELAKVSCGAKSLEEAHNLFPIVPAFDLPYLCMDLVYVYSILADGFGIDPTEVVTALNTVQYEGSSFRVQWTLGAALELVSSKHTKMEDIPNVLLSSHTSNQVA
ncbi:hypothetical protein LUZ61_020072 [Rhynchospora tenuis]|uniref:Apyrase n=1 Tax=Rhynchospora tenuis TaxID=198213 RepID=A0AAD5ZCG7_9POAL|nr:hypothetical protein LUZ61_020072 [Rhynchospora tenuis]